MMTEEEAAELAARIEKDLLAQPGVCAVYPASGAGRLREAAANLLGSGDAPRRVGIRPGDPLRIDVALGLDHARPAGETARAVQRIIRDTVSGPVQIRVTVAHLDASSERPDPVPSPASMDP